MLQVVEGFVEILGGDVLTRLVLPVAQDEANDATHSVLRFVDSDGWGQILSCVKLLLAGWARLQMRDL